MAGLRFNLLAGTALTLVGVAGAGSAFADTTLGWYVSGSVGHAPMASQSLSISDVTANGSGGVSAVPVAAKSLKTDYDARGFVAAGYRLNRNLRAEVELGAHPGKLVAGLGGPDKTSLGTLDKTSLMANLIYDVAPDWGVHPFIGVGVGAVQAKADYAQPATVNGHTMAYTIHSDTFTPAAQAIAGASLYVTSNLRFDLTYRYLRTGRVSYDVAVTDQYAGASNSYTAHASDSLTDQSISVGLRWAFGYAPPLEVADRSLRSSDEVAAATRPATPVAVAQPAPPAVPLAKPAPVTVAALAPAAPQGAQVPSPEDTVPWTDDPNAVTPDFVPDSTMGKQKKAKSGKGAAPVAVAELEPAAPAPDTQAGTSKKTRRGRKAAAPAAIAPPAPTESTQVAMAATPAPTAPVPASATDTAGVSEEVTTQPVKATPWSAKQTRRHGRRAHGRRAAAQLMSVQSHTHYTVYFPLGGAVLNPKAQWVVVNAAQLAHSQPASTVAVVGYADTSGAAAYNLSLSHRRAKAVVTNLVANGVPETTISIAWKGETHLAVKTRNGVACAKNRRVTVNVRY